jgi:hypothetical protein
MRHLCASPTQEPASCCIDASPAAHDFAHASPLARRRAQSTCFCRCHAGRCDATPRDQAMRASPEVATPACPSLVMIARIAGIPRVSGSFGISIQVGTSGPGASSMAVSRGAGAPGGAGDNGSLTMVGLPSFSAGPCDRGNLCPRRPKARGRSRAHRAALQQRANRGGRTRREGRRLVQPNPRV